MDDPIKPEHLVQLRTPLEIVNRIGWVLFYLRKATHTIHELRKDYVAKKDAYSQAHKQKVLDLLKESAGSRSGGTKEDRENKAQLALWNLYMDMSDAQMALTYAQEKKQDLETELSALQSETKLTIKEIELAARTQ